MTHRGSCTPGLSSAENGKMMRTVPGECSCSSMVTGPSHLPSRAHPLLANQPWTSILIRSPTHKPFHLEAGLKARRGQSRRTGHASASTSEPVSRRRPEYVPGRIDDPRCVHLAEKLSSVAAHSLDLLPLPNSTEALPRSHLSRGLLLFARPCELQVTYDNVQLCG